MKVIYFTKDQNESFQTREINHFQVTKIQKNETPKKYPKTGWRCNNGHAFWINP